MKQKSFIQLATFILLCFMMLNLVGCVQAKPDEPEKTTETANGSTNAGSFRNRSTIRT